MFSALRIFIMIAMTALFMSYSQTGRNVRPQPLITAGPVDLSKHPHFVGPLPQPQTGTCPIPPTRLLTQTTKNRYLLSYARVFCSRLRRLEAMAAAN